MSREIDTTMQLSQEEWLAMRSHIVALMKGAKEEALRTSLGGIIPFLTEYPEARDQLSELLCNASATTFSNGLLEFVITAQRKAFERAIGKGTCSLEEGYAEWEEFDEKGNGCDAHQKEEVAKYLAQRLHFLDGSTWHGRYVKGNLNARALLEDLLKEIVSQSVRSSTADEIELEDRRKDSSQSRSPGFRGGAGFNLRERRKTGSPGALSSTTEDSLQLASEPTATSELDMWHELPNSTLNSASLLQPRTNKS